MLILFFTLILLVSIVGCGSNQDEDNGEVPSIRMATGPSGLTVHTLGSTFSEYIKDDILITVEPGSPNGNAISVNDGNHEFGISMTTAVVNGYNGTNFYEDKNNLENIRVVAVLWHHYLLPITGNKDIIEISQLEDKKFTCGPPGGDAEPLAKILLSYEGLGEDDYSLTPYTFTEAVEALKNRQIDVLLAGAPMPNSLHEDLGKTLGARYVTIGKENAERVVNEYPGLYFMEFDQPPSGVELDSPYYTASYRAVIITNADTSDELVYTFTKGLYENFENLGNAIGNMKTFPVESLVDEVGNVPLHPGALQFYEEVGIVE